VSDEARNLVKELLTIDNEKRIRADQIINHPWMVIEARRANLNSVQENIKKFKNKLRQVINAIRAVRIMQGLRIKS
jgi:serine/threonine protein kinase